MPTTARWIGEMREAFGPETINAAIKDGLAGNGTFYAKENGIEVWSRPIIAPGAAINGNDIARNYVKGDRK